MLTKDNFPLTYFFYANKNLRKHKKLSPYKIFHQNKQSIKVNPNQMELEYFLFFNDIIISFLGN